MTGSAATRADTSPADPAGAIRAVPSAAWDGLLARFGVVDTYLSAGYHRLSAALEPPGTRTVLLHFRDRGGEIALPLLLRPLTGVAGWDATSAYGYGGPVGTGRPDVAAFGAALDAWSQEHGVVSTFLRLHPVLDNARLVPPTAHLVEAGSTMAWDVSPGRDLVRGMHRMHQKAGRKADRAGLELTVVTRPADLEPFRRLYLETMRRQSADPYFFFPQPYWDALLADDPVVTPVLVEGRLDGRLAAGLLCLTSGAWLHAHLGGWDDEARLIGASNRIYQAAATWAQEQGLSGFHLGGGVGGNADSSLFLFKQRFDPAATPRTFRIAKMVHEPALYRRLTGSDCVEGFFPPWRRSS